MLEWIAAVLLVLVAVAHSTLGETDIVRPLFAHPSLGTKYPRWAVERIVRFAWHLTSLAWVALAAMLVGASVPVTFGIVCLASGLLILAVLPGHFAWVLFLPAGLLALWVGNALPDAVLWVGVWVGVVVAVVAGGFHVAWALGSRRGAANVLPQDPVTGQPVGVPSRWLTGLVALGLFAYAAVALLATQAAGGPVRWAAIAAFVICTARVLGDGKRLGLSKRLRDTGFSRADDKYWTPLVGVLALSAGAALTLAVTP